MFPCQTERQVLFGPHILPAGQQPPVVEPGAGGQQIDWLEQAPPEMQHIEPLA